MNIKELKKIKLPNKPGVYFFLKGKEILYIGKATSLKDRVKSYFGKDLIATRGAMMVDMVFKADGVKFTITDSVLEALILEAELIKKYQPKYNTKEKSDKSFNYVCITKDKLPKVLIKRGKNLQQGYKNSDHFTLPGVPGGSYTDQNFYIPASNTFGPFTNSSQLREALKIIRKIFPFMDEKSKNYKEFYRQINLMPDLEDRKMYLQNIRNIKLFLSGKKPQILRNLKKEMAQYAKNKEFEKAGEIKRQIFALGHINDVSLLKLEPRNVNPESNFRVEAYDIAHMAGRNIVGVMTVVEDGEVNKSEYKKFKIKSQAKPNDTGALREVLERRLKHDEWTYPSLIVMDGGVAQRNVALKILKNMNLDIPVVSVVKDDKHKPKAVLGSKVIGVKYKNAILLANSEAHRFAISYHKSMRNKNFLKNAK